MGTEIGKNIKAATQTDDATSLGDVHLSDARRISHREFQEMVDAEGEWEFQGFVCNAGLCGQLKEPGQYEHVAEFRSSKVLVGLSAMEEREDHTPWFVSATSAEKTAGYLMTIFQVKDGTLGSGTSVTFVAPFEIAKEFYELAKAISDQTNMNNVYAPSNIMSQCIDAAWARGIQTCANMFGSKPTVGKVSSRKRKSR